MNSITSLFPGQKTYAVCIASIVVGIVALIVPEAVPGIEAGQLIQVGVVGLFLRMGIGKAPSK